MTVGSRESRVGSRKSVVGGPVPAPEQSTADSTLSTPAFGLPTAAHANRVVIEHVRPAIDSGRFAIKRTVGERVDVSADIFADGHDIVAAVLRDRPHLTAEDAKAAERVGADPRV